MTIETAHNIVRISNAALALRAHNQATMSPRELTKDIEINQAMDSAFPEAAAAVTTAKAILLGN